MRTAISRSIVVSLLVLAVGCGESSETSPTVATVTGSSPTASNTTTSTTESPPHPPGLSEHSITVGSVSRSYLVHVPSSPGEPRAVVFVLHGGGGRGPEVALEGSSPLSVFRSVADREGFVVVYPAGEPSDDPRGRNGWVDCRSDNEVSTDVDDVEFLAALIELVRNEYAMPTSRIFMAGSSNGAQMTQAFAFHHPELLGGIASNAGSLPAKPRPGRCTEGPERPVPVLLVHGTADPLMPYRGGCVADIGGGCRRGSVVSAEETRDRWLTIDGLNDVAPVETVFEVDPNDGGAAHRFEYEGPVPLEWWRLDGGGHSGPSRIVSVDTNRLNGIQNRDVEFAEIAWSFFERQLTAE